MFKLSVHSSSNKIDPAEIAKEIKPHLETWLYKHYRIEHRSYSVVSTKDDHLHRIDDIDIGLNAIHGAPRTVILHFENRSKDSSAAPHEVDFWITSHPSSNETKYTAYLKGRHIEELTEARDNLVLDVTDIIGACNISQSNLEDGQSFPFNGGSASFQNPTTATIDSRDRSMRAGGPRIQRVFISYSHDSDDHKEWVLRLAQELNSLGIWLYFDQWDVNLGSDLPLFMESSVSESDRILAICTEGYKRKVDAGIGHSGYEKMLMTPELMKDQSSARVIPLVRSKSSADDVVPAFLSTKLYIDFSDDSLFESKLDALAAELINARNTRPPLGTNRVGLSR